MTTWENKTFFYKFPIIDKTANALTTIQTLILQIDDTKHNAKIVDALKLGTKTLKTALDEKNITVDSVDDTLADVKEILDMNADIQFALSGAQFNDLINDVADDSALEAELNELLEEDSNVVPIVSTLPSSVPVQPKATINNVIDDLLEARLKNLKMDGSSTINVTIDNNTNSTKRIESLEQSAATADN